MSSFALLEEEQAEIHRILRRPYPRWSAKTLTPFYSAPPSWPEPASSYRTSPDSLHDLNCTRPIFIEHSDRVPDLRVSAIVAKVAFVRSPNTLSPSEPQSSLVAARHPLLELRMKAARRRVRRRQESPIPFTH